MALELYYTSAPRGLRPGSSGFCTVAMTAGMAAALAQRLESLSGYRPLYPVGSPDAQRNPVDLAHWRLEGAAPFVSVLSQVRFAGADEQGRFNKLAHHLVLRAEEQSAAGPAWVLRQPGVMQPRWVGEPRTLEEPRQVPRGDSAPQVCRAWAAAAGDAGWAGVVVEAFLLDSSRPTTVIYPPDMDVLALFAEAIALMPERFRWRVTLSTYFTALPAGMSCAWRGCAADSSAARAAAGSGAGSQGLVIDLTRPLSPPRESKYVAMARTGQASDAPEPAPRPARITAPEYRPAPPPVTMAAGPLNTEPALPDEAAFIPPAAPADDEAPRHDEVRRVALWAAAILWPIVVLAIGWMVMSRRAASVPPGDANAAATGHAAQLRALQQREAQLNQRIIELESELHAARAARPDHRPAPTP